MNKSLLLGALCASILAGLASVPAPAQTLAAPDATKPSGAALFNQARALLKVAGPNGSPLTRGLAPDENLRRQRLAVARNAPALAKLREALKANVTNAVGVPDLSSGADAREFARQLAQESAVRAADGDALGAADSALDALELGAQTSSGSVIAWLTGNAIASVGRASLNEIAPQLDAAQTRAVITRLAIIQIEVPTIEAVLRGEEQIALELGRPLVQDPKARAKMQAQLLQPESALNNFTREQTRAVLALAPAQFESNVRAVFAEAAMRAAQPYQTAANADDLKGADPVTDLVKPSTGGLWRFAYERRNLDDQLALGALRLRLIKLESGAYPTTFEAGTDPFSPTLAPLIYKRVGDSYVLYSVGPDGKDENGAEIQTLRINQETGAKSVSDRLSPDSFGDILAPEL